MPAKADTKKQREFLGDTLLPLIERAKNGAVELFFMDASHFVMGCFAGRVWSVVRRYVKTASGRRRYNVLGALNFVTKKIETVCNDSYITSIQVIEMLEKLAATYEKPIKIVLDNVRYHKSRIVLERAVELGIELVFLPTYSPNLNLIERVWKIVKSKVLNSAYYGTFDAFSDNISRCVNLMHEECASEMASAVTQNFHIIDETYIIS